MSIYGRDVRLSTVITESAATNGNAVRSPDRNCELTLPSTVTSPPLTGPHTVRGKCPSQVSMLAPSARNGASIISTGRDIIDPCPVMVTGRDANAAIGVKRRVESPDSPIDKVSEAGDGVECPVIVTLPPLIVTVAPSDSATDSAAFVSLQSPMFRRIDSPSASAATAMARCA